MQPRPPAPGHTRKQAFSLFPISPHALPPQDLPLRNLGRYKNTPISEKSADRDCCSKRRNLKNRTSTSKDGEVYPCSIIYINMLSNISQLGPGLAAKISPSRFDLNAKMIRRAIQASSWALTERGINAATNPYSNVRQANSTRRASGEWILNHNWLKSWMHLRQKGKWKSTHKSSSGAARRGTK